MNEWESSSRVLSCLCLLLYDMWGCRAGNEAESTTGVSSVTTTIAVLELFHLPIAPLLFRVFGRVSFSHLYMSVGFNMSERLRYLD